MIAILDIDGTLVDSNYQHALAWFRALRDHGLVVPIWRIHRAIGMGGDQVISHLCGDDAEERLGDAVRESEGKHYFEMIQEVQPLEGSRDLVLALKQHGHTVVMASSAKEEEVEHYLTLLGARDLVDQWTHSADVEQTKPAPDLVQAALEKAGGGDAFLVGDTPWDVQAAAGAGRQDARRADGGFSTEELTEAGAEAVFDSIKELLDRLDETPLGAAA
jgi:phosphoglycolate phosphatase-like HAD superfamily hydrolase